MIMVFKEMASFRREGTPAAGDTVLVALPSRVEVNHTVSCSTE